MYSLFSNNQWKWIAERFREGYSIKELSKFLGVNRETVRRGLIRMGVKPECRAELPSLSERWREFLSLPENM